MIAMQSRSIDAALIVVEGIAVIAERALRHLAVSPECANITERRRSLGTE
jgi:hypothetical protein